MSSREIQRKRLALTITSNMMDDSSVQSLLSQTSQATSAQQQQQHQHSPHQQSTNSTAAVSGNSFYSMFSPVNHISLVFNNSSSYSPTQVTNNSSNTAPAAPVVTFMTQTQVAQINELNAIMACVAMFASSMVVQSKTTNATLTPDSSINHSSGGSSPSTTPPSPTSIHLVPQSSISPQSSSATIIDSVNNRFYFEILNKIFFRLLSLHKIMVLLEPLMLCSGGITFTMRYFLNEISTHIPELKLSIHENLLKILSIILTGKPLYQVIQAISMSASHLIRSNNFYSLMATSNGANMSTPTQPAQNQPQQQQSTLQQIEQAPPPKTDIESTIQALQTLRSFEFSSIYMIAFLRYCVDFYLQHDSRLVKIECVITTSTLLTRLISQLDAQDSRSLISIISCALRKLLICAITDYEPDVRYQVLNCLDSDNKFNMFVALPENLNILFMCVRDERAEIRELSASMISRLSASNSAYILPFIRKILMQLLTEIDIYPDIAQREKSVRLMGHLLSHAPRLVNLYVKPLLDCLHSKGKLFTPLFPSEK
jgi:hypothetical protein